MISAVADADFIATCYEVFLGRELESLEVVRDRAGWPLTDVLRSIVCSSEFIENILPALETGLPFRPGRFTTTPHLRQRLWAVELLSLDGAESEKVMSCSDWATLLGVFRSDKAFRDAVRWPEPW